VTREKIFNHRFNERETLMQSMDRIKKELPPELSSAKTCAMIGAGYGHLDLEFVGADGCLPDVNEIAAVDPDADLLAEFKRRVTKLFPAVRTSFYTETAQNWKGGDKPFDVVLMVELLYFVSPTQRPPLFKKLFDKVVASGGFVLLYTYPDPLWKPTTCFGRLVNRLNCPSLEDTDVGQIRDMMISAGFTYCCQVPMECQMNVKEPADDFFSLWELWSEGMLSKEEVREVACEEFGETKVGSYPMILSVFKKP